MKISYIIHTLSALSRFYVYYLVILKKVDKFFCWMLDAGCWIATDIIFKTLSSRITFVGLAH
jgi:hypothetical protein